MKLNTSNRHLILSFIGILLICPSTFHRLLTSPSHFNMFIAGFYATAVVLLGSITFYQVYLKGVLHGKKN